MPYYHRLPIRGRSLGFIAVVAAVAAGCGASCRGGQHDGGGEPLAEAERSAVAMAPASAAARLIGEVPPAEPPGTVQLVEAGREPRRLLRYTSVPGARRRMHFGLLGSTDVDLGGSRSFMEQKTNTEIWYSFEVVGVTGDRLDCEVQFERTDLTDWTQYNPRRHGDLRRSIDVRGYKYRFAIDRQGFAELPAVELPERLDTDRDRDVVWTLANEVARSQIPLPTEPVGVGARWRLDEEDRGRFFLPGRWITDIELSAVRGERLEISIVRQFIVPAQLLTIDSGGLTGMSRTVSSYRARATIDLGFPQPIELKGTADVRLEGLRVQLAEQVPVRLLVKISDSMSGS